MLNLLVTVIAIMLNFKLFFNCVHLLCGRMVGGGGLIVVGRCNIFFSMFHRLIQLLIIILYIEFASHIDRSCVNLLTF